MPRGRKKQAKALRAEYTRTIDPARAHAAEILNLERTLSDLVNQAYALTPAEIDLMWQTARSEEHTSELQSLRHLVCRLLLEKKTNVDISPTAPRDSRTSLYHAGAPARY